MFPQKLAFVLLVSNKVSRVIRVYRIYRVYRSVVDRNVERRSPDTPELCVLVDEL